MSAVLLAGKDYFTEVEAAAYACVSESQFRAKRAEYGLQGFWWMGKKVYRKADDDWTSFLLKGGGDKP